MSGQDEVKQRAEAASRVAYLVQSKTAFVAVCWQIVIEPPIRLGYWGRSREAA